MIQLVLSEWDLTRMLRVQRKTLTVIKFEIIEAVLVFTCLSFALQMRFLKMDVPS